jgi:hypothetical protein
MRLLIVSNKPRPSNLDRGPFRITQPAIASGSFESRLVNVFCDP